MSINTPYNNSDRGSYTFSTNLSEEYIERLTTLGNRHINDILRTHSWSLRVNVDGHVINSVYTKNQRSTSSLYISTIRDVYNTFLLRCGYFESALAFHDHAPVECWSSHENILQTSYQYRIDKQGDILKNNNSTINDVITQPPIRNVGGWKSNSLPGRFRPAVEA